MFLELKSSNISSLAQKSLQHIPLNFNDERILIIESSISFSNFQVGTENERPTRNEIIETEIR